MNSRERVNRSSSARYREHPIAAEAAPTQASVDGFGIQFAPDALAAGGFVDGVEALRMQCEFLVGGAKDDRAAGDDDVAEEVRAALVGAGIEGEVQGYLARGHRDVHIRQQLGIEQAAVEIAVRIVYAQALA